MSIGSIHKPDFISRNPARRDCGDRADLERRIESVIAQLPALKKPTVSPLWGDEGFAVEIIIEEHQARDLIPRLKRAGASGLVEYPLNKVVY